MQTFSPKICRKTNKQCLQNISLFYPSPASLLWAFLQSLCFFMFVWFFLFEASISSSITLQDSVKWFHPLLDRDFYSFPSWWCNFINICRKKARANACSISWFFFFKILFFTSTLQAGDKNNSCKWFKTIFRWHLIYIINRDTCNTPCIEKGPQLTKRI